MLKVGPYRIDVIETCRFGLDGGAMFGVVPKTLWERAYAPADARNRIPMAAKALLLRSDDRTILIDTGNSPLMPQKLQDIYGVDFSEYTLEKSLEKLGVASGDITDVILTHLHFDHAGGSTTNRRDLQGLEGTGRDSESLEGTRSLIPSFANAKYYVQKEHYDWALNPKEKDRASFMPENYMPLVEHGVLEFLDGPGEIFPGVFLELAHGHTRALQTVRVSDGTSTVYYPADLMPTGAHIHIPYGMGYDNFPLTTIEEKKIVLPRAIEEEWIVVFEHDALRQAARIVQADRGVKLSDDIVIT